jgi:hypothetical protein
VQVAGYKIYQAHEKDDTYVKNFMDFKNGAVQLLISEKETVEEEDFSADIRKTVISLNSNKSNLL